MDFNNYDNYIVLIDEIIDCSNINLFEVDSLDLNINIPSKILIKNITDININGTCELIKSYNKSDFKITNLVKINLDISLEFMNQNNELEVIFLKDTIATKLISNNILKVKLYFHLNFSYIYIENKNLYFSMIYTIYHRNCSL